MSPKIILLGLFLWALNCMCPLRGSLVSWREEGWDHNLLLVMEKPNKLLNSYSLLSIWFLDFPFYTHNNLIVYVSFIVQPAQILLWKSAGYQLQINKCHTEEPFLHTSRAYSRLHRAFINELPPVTVVKMISYNWGALCVFQAGKASDLPTLLGFIKSWTATVLEGFWVPG